MDNFNIRSIAVLTILMLICLTGSALAEERLLGADDPPWVLNPNCETVDVKVSSINLDMVMSLIKVTYKPIEGGVEETSFYPFNFGFRAVTKDFSFSKRGKLVKQITFDVTRGKLKYEVTYLHFYKCAPGQPGC